MTSNSTSSAADPTPHRTTSAVQPPDTQRPGGAWHLTADARTETTASTLSRTVSRIGYGAMQLERLHGDRAAAVAVLRRAVELGVDHVDTAQFYGDGLVNDLIREAISPSDSVVVSSKVGADPDPGARVPLRPAQRPEQLRASVEDNLRALGVEQVPLVNLRRLDKGPGLVAEGDQLVDLDDQLAVMTALRDEGKIGAIGLSAVPLDVLRRAIPAGIACVQNAYSLVTREDEEMLELCAAQDIAWAPFCPLGGTFPGLPKATEEPLVRATAEAIGATPAQVGLAWLLRHAPNTLLIPGTTSIGHLEENVAVGELALDRARLDDATVARLDAIPSRSADIRLT